MRMHGVDVSRWDGTLAAAEGQLRQAAHDFLRLLQQCSCARCPAGAQPASGQMCPGNYDAAALATRDFDHWSRVIGTHPDKLVAEKSALIDWERRQQPKNAEMHAWLSTIVPHDITNTPRAGPSE